VAKLLSLKNVLGLGKGADTTPYHLAIVHGDTCKLEEAISALLRSGVAANLASVHIEILRSKPSSMVRRLEAMMTTYEVMLERNPASASLKAKMEVLARIVDGIVRGRIVDVIVALAFRDIPCSSLKESLTYLELLGCKVRVECNTTVLAGSSLRGFLDLDALSKLVGRLYDLKTPAPASVSVLLGYDERTGAPIFLPLMDEQGALHTLVVGPTGTGKTTLLATIVLRVIATDIAEAGVVVIDPKGDLASMLRNANVDRSHVELRLEDLSSLSEEEKYSIMSEVVAEVMRASRRSRGLKLLVVDEAWRLASEHSAITRLVKEARTLEIAVILATQDPADYPDTVWNNATNVVVFGSSSRAYKEILSRFIPLRQEESKALERLGLGRALLWSRFYGKIVPVALSIEPLVLKHGASS
jgi:thymidine kinase